MRQPRTSPASRAASCCTRTRRPTRSRWRRSFRVGPIRAKTTSFGVVPREEFDARRSWRRCPTSRPTRIPSSRCKRQPLVVASMPSPVLPRAGCRRRWAQGEAREKGADTGGRRRTATAARSPRAEAPTSELRASKTLRCLGGVTKRQCRSRDRRDRRERGPPDRGRRNRYEPQRYRAAARSSAPRPALGRAHVRAD